MNERNNQTSIAVLKPESDVRLPSLRDTGVEVAATFAAARAKAIVEARYVMALRQPRNWDKVRQDILKECRRPGFARNKSTYYVKPIGEGVEGLGIRFAEVAVRCMGNILIAAELWYEDREKEVHTITVTDLESNVPYEQVVRVPKTVERSKRPDNPEDIISERKNSWGKTVYTVVGTEDDIANKRGAANSKAIRTLVLRLLPGYIQDDAEAVIKEIRLDEAAQDPDAERKKIADAFADLNVPVDQLMDYLGHPLGTCSPAELVKLRGLHGAIKDGETTWAAVMENLEQQPKAGEKAAPTSTTESAKVDIAPAAANDAEEAPRRRRASAAIE